MVVSFYSSQQRAQPPVLPYLNRPSAPDTAQLRGRRRRWRRPARERPPPPDRGAATAAPASLSTTSAVHAALDIVSAGERSSTGLSAPWRVSPLSALASVWPHGQQSRRGQRQPCL